MSATLQGPVHAQYQDGRHGLGIVVVVGRILSKPQLNRNTTQETITAVGFDMIMTTPPPQTPPPQCKLT